MLFAMIQEIIKLPASIKPVGSFLRCCALKNSSVVFASGEINNKIKLDPITKIH
jgi:hypothetical protein